MAGTFTHSKLRTGPAAVYFDGTCLGVSLGPVEWTPETVTRPRNTARWGESNVDIIHTGEKHTVKATLAENSIAVLATVLPEGLTTGSVRYFGRLPGGKLSDHAKQLLLRPIDKDAQDDSSEDMVLHKAAVTACEPVGWTHDKERAFAVTFEAIVDDTQDDGKKIGYVKGVA